MEKAYLVLSNGMVFEGQRLGAAGESTGELVFQTGVVGYLETLTDPSYAGQIVMQTFPLIGNYGVIEADFEGQCAVSGYVVRECCDMPSNFRSEYELDTFLKNQSVCGICGVDTRQLTRIIRDEGVMNAKICSSIPQDLEPIRTWQAKDPLGQVSCKEAKVHPARGEKRFCVTLIDYGVKNSIIQALCQRGCEVTQVPYHTAAEQILSADPDGVLLSNGPGDPAEYAACIAQIKELIGKVPLFGIGLGHQLLALAMGGKTQKLLYGHRGTNQPVKDQNGTRTYITAQNHGYAVVGESLEGIGKITFTNANDGSCEGVEYPGKQCFSVQFYPQTNVDGKETAFLYDRMIAMMGGKQDAQR